MFCVARTHSMFESASSEDLVFIVHIMQEARLSEENLLCEIFLYLKISPCIVNTVSTWTIQRRGTPIYTSYVYREGGGWYIIFVSGLLVSQLFSLKSKFGPGLSLGSRKQGGALCEWVRGTFGFCPLARFCPAGCCLSSTNIFSLHCVFVMILLGRCWRGRVAWLTYETGLAHFELPCPLFNPSQYTICRQLSPAIYNI